MRSTQPGENSDCLRCVTGFTVSPGDYREKEGMYDEIIRLKKVTGTVSFILSLPDLWLISGPVLCPESPRAEDGQPADESQTAPPGGR